MENLPALCICNILLLSKTDTKTAKAVELRDNQNKKSKFKRREIFKCNNGRSHFWGGQNTNYISINQLEFTYRTLFIHRNVGQSALQS